MENVGCISDTADAGSRLRIGLLDEERLFRDAFQLLIRRELGTALHWEAGSAEEAYRRIAQDSADIVVLDLLIHGGGGLQVMREILHRAPTCRMLVLSHRNNPELAAQALSAGAAAYASKEDSAGAVIDAIRGIAGSDGPAPIRPEFTGARRAEPAPQQDPLHQLSPREQQVFRLLVRDLSNDQIADILGISRRTVETHRARVLRKLHLHSFRALLRFALRIGEPLE